MTDIGLILKLFDKPDEVRTMTKGRFELSQCDSILVTS